MIQGANRIVQYNWTFVPANLQFGQESSYANNVLLWTGVPYRSVTPYADLPALPLLFNITRTGEADPVATIILTRGRGVLVPFEDQSSYWAQARRGDRGMTPLFHEEPQLEALLFMPVDIGFGRYGTLPVCNLTAHSNGVLETESQGNTDLVRVIRGVEDPTAAEVELFPELQSPDVHRKRP